MGRRVEGVVDGDAGAGAQAGVGVHHRRAAAVGEDVIVSRDAVEKGVARIGGDTPQGRGRVHVPERHQRGPALQVEHEEFRDAVLAGSVGPGVVTLREGMRTVLVADAVIESADKGESIAL